MKKIFTTTTFLLTSISFLFSQKIYTSAPQIPVRTMAEWEEVQAVAISWDMQQTAILAEIVRNVQLEANVIIVCNDSTFLKSAKSRLQAANVDINKNITFQLRKTNTIWIRDYGPNSVYFNDVDSLAFVDWRYNRNLRTSDDIVPDAIGSLLKKSVFKTLTGNEDLVNTGGNFMTDGLGTAFASKLILDENFGKPATGVLPFSSKKSEAKIDSIMQEYMGINRYIKMNVLPFDGIHHIDMHMKLLDEETLLVGKYPDGIADGPQIEANIQYILSQFKTPFGKKYDIVRIPMPPDLSGKYPDSKGIYRTYANAVFVNKTVLLPVYEQKYDTTALRIWQNALPGHKIVGINCNAIIPQSGAIHCITKEIGVNEPLWIAHSKVKGYIWGAWGDKGASITALIKHKEGIKNATVKYRLRGTNQWKSLPMQLGKNNEWVAALTPKEIVENSPVDSVYYYIEAEANNGKKITRPITGERGAWRFFTAASIATNDLVKNPNIEISKIYPNPAHAITCIEIESEAILDAKIVLLDINGRVVNNIYNGALEEGLNKYFFDASHLESGVYIVQVSAGAQQKVSRVVVTN